ncbi:MAG TPA: YdeI/OmpD-associated family protein [Candidatus Elarobacter sp.]|jgi:hypothetical protein|nr:YdeI/OmpD-associated family protein [Candidatus Elarobacter sp.]
MVRFRALIEHTHDDDPGTWWIIRVPGDVSAHLEKARRVRGTVNGVSFKGPLLRMGGGVCGINPTKAIYRTAGVGVGDVVTVEIERDPDGDTVPIPAELAAALKANASLARAFEEFSPAHRREYATWIGSAKKPETRVARAEKALAMIADRKRV